LVILSSGSGIYSVSRGQAGNRRPSLDSLRVRT
jgi:hypothetical protein